MPCTDYNCARMALTSGTKLGPYEIVAPLGAGGMGEVYRARDTKLGREVALKLLPPLFTADADRMARFKREARRQITDFGERATFIARRVSWSSDGRSILAAVAEGDSDIVLLEGLTNVGRE